MTKILLTSFLIFFKLVISVFANPNIDARTGILIDYHSNEILENDPDAQIYPASMTKMTFNTLLF